MADIYLYAELLLNIRQITGFAILPSDYGPQSRIELCGDQRNLKLWHDDEEVSIELPCPVVTDANLKTSTIASRELSFRLSIQKDTGPLIKHRYGTDGCIPWPASKMTRQTRLACQSCGHLLVHEVRDWKDLPSEGWADMMDFWHCHKPRIENGSHDSAGDQKGYAASNVVGPRIGVGLVHISYFHIIRSDCHGMQKNPGKAYLECSSCHEFVGIEDGKDENVQLYKYSVSVQLSPNTSWQTYSVQEIVSAQLLALIDELAIHKFVAHSENKESSEQMHDGLLLWVFTPDLMYSTSKRPPQRAMKVFYKTLTSPLEMLEKQGNHIEELQLPSYAFKVLHKEITASTNILPPAARSYQDWTIGLLDR